MVTVGHIVKGLCDPRAKAHPCMRSKAEVEFLRGLSGDVLLSYVHPVKKVKGVIPEYVFEILMLCLTINNEIVI